MNQAQTISNALKQFREDVPDYVACGFVDLSTGMLLDVDTVSNHPREILDVVEPDALLGSILKELPEGIGWIALKKEKVIFRLQDVHTSGPRAEAPNAAPPAFPRSSSSRSRLGSGSRPLQPAQDFSAAFDEAFGDAASSGERKLGLSP